MITMSMAEPGFSEAPLATFEFDDDFEDNNALALSRAQVDDLLDEDDEGRDADAEEEEDEEEEDEEDDDYGEGYRTASLKSKKALINDNEGVKNKMQESVVVNNFNEDFSGSLEDLVSTFDDQITNCFRNFNEETESIAPVQIRNQEDVHSSDCQMWWTITGNFGNILPIDWSKTFAQPNQLPSRRQGIDDETEESEAFDLHKIVISPQKEPIMSADDVINEIDAMMDDTDVETEATTSVASSPTETGTPTDDKFVCEELLRFKEMINEKGAQLSQEQYVDSLRSLSNPTLRELLEEIEFRIKEFSETLITELALRDELEYEKELKNEFINSLLSVQNKRRLAVTARLEAAKNRNRNRKRSGSSDKNSTSYLTTVIPYTKESAADLNVPTLQALIKILHAIDADSQQVPPLLTNYILNVLCPKGNDNIDNNDNKASSQVASKRKEAEHQQQIISRCIKS